MPIDVDRFSPSIVPDVVPDDRRARLFRESAMERLERWVLGLAWPLKPQRIGGLPALARLWVAGPVAPHHALPRPGSPPNTAGLWREGAGPAAAAPPEGARARAARE